jgi:acyl-CoA thioester hydrolase
MNQEFTWPIRVYYEDTDAGGVVFYANYLKYFERARTEWLRAAGIEQKLLAENQGIIFVVKSVALDYHAPAKLDDELKVTVVVEKQGRASIQVTQEAWLLKEGHQELLTTGRIKVGCIDGQTFRPCVIPNDIALKLANRK